MSEYIKSAWVYWKLAIFQGFNGWSMAVLAAFLGYTDGADWQDHRMKIFRLVAFCYIGGGKYLEGFLNQTVNRLMSGKPPAAPNGDTNQLLKSEVPKV